MKIKYLILILSVLFFTNCEKDEDQTTNENPTNNISTETISSIGGTVEVEGRFKIVIPENALTSPTEVTIGITGNEPITVPNSNFTITGEPFSVIIPVENLNESAEIIIPIPNDFQGTDNVGFFALQEGKYMPLFYQLSNENISITLDILNFQDDYNSTLDRSTTFLGELVIIGLYLEQIQPPAEELGLKKVTYSNGDFNFTEPNSLNNNDKTLILVHGWTGNPSGTWEVAIPHFQNGNYYDNILTFGYNTSNNIDENGLNLANALDSYLSQNMDIDIVAHSMGGLVSRSAIENHNGENYVNRLVTLGTPHQGSPFASWRNAIGVLVSLDTNIIGTLLFNDITEGISDMTPNSDFLDSLNSNTNIETSYYALSGYRAVGSDTGFISNLFEDNNDGVVEETSALGISNNNTLGFPTSFPIDETGIQVHKTMMKDISVIDNVEEYLEYNINSITTFNGNVTLSTQQEIDTFASNNYTNINGYLYIGNQSSITNINDLSGLINLTTINVGTNGNGLRIENTQLNSLNGLNNLSTLIGSIDLVNNDNLNDISQLSGITSLGNLQVFNCDNLSGLNGLHNLETVGNLTINQNSSLTNLNLSSLISSNNFEIISNEVLSNLNSLSNLSSINALWVTQNNQLDDFCSLNNLISNDGISGNYVVNSNLYNPTLQDLINGNCSQ